MNNPSRIEQPKFTNPVSGAMNQLKKDKKNKGNKPYLDMRKRIRKDIFR